MIKIGLGGLSINLLAT